jgi:hypothetical protein
LRCQIDCINSKHIPDPRDNEMIRIAKDGGDEMISNRHSYIQNSPYSILYFIKFMNLCIILILNNYTDMHNNNCPANLICISNDEQNNNVSNKCIKCGMPFNPRIVGGTEATPHSIPWQVIRHC